MSLNLDQKKAVVAEVAEVAAEAHSVVGADYRGLTVAQMSQLRSKAREGGVYLRVVKNTLARRAVEGTEFECLRDGLTGPLMLAFSLEEPGAAARVIRDYAKGNDKLEPRFVGFAGQVASGVRFGAPGEYADPGTGNPACSWPPCRRPLPSWR